MRLAQRDLEVVRCVPQRSPKFLILRVNAKTDFALARGVRGPLDTEPVQILAKTPAFPILPNLTPCELYLPYHPRQERSE